MVFSGPKASRAPFLPRSGARLGRKNPWQRHLHLRAATHGATLGEFQLILEPETSENMALAHALVRPHGTPGLGKTAWSWDFYGEDTGKTTWIPRVNGSKKSDIVGKPDRNKQLVGGIHLPTPLKKWWSEFVSWDDDIPFPTEWENKTCSKTTNQWWIFMVNGDLEFVYGIWVDDEWGCSCFFEWDFIWF